MSVERTTTNFSLKIPVLAKTYKTEMDFNLDTIDSLLKAMTQTTTHTANSANPSLDVSNSGAGYGIKVDKMQITTEFDVAQLSKSSDIEILPDSATTGNGITFSVDSSYLRMTTGQANGFHFFSAVKFENAITLQSDLNVNLKIIGATGVEFYSTSSAGFKFYPDHGSYATKYGTP